VIAVAAVALSLASAPAAAHHVGTYTARDNEISQNFKQLKFAIQARKLDVAVRLFDEGAVRREMRARAAQLPAGLETTTRTALGAGDAPRAEAGLALLFAALARDLAAEAQTKVADPSASADARRATANRFLEAIWRYWNLIDFVVSQRDPKAGTAMRLAFDEAETLARGTASPAAGNPCAGPRPATGRPADPARLARPFTEIGRVLGGVVETLNSVTRRES